MTWEKNLFPTPQTMQNNLGAHGRKLVTIIDPHVKRERSYPMFTEAEEKGYYVRNKHGRDFDGWVREAVTVCPRCVDVGCVIAYI